MTKRDVDNPSAVVEWLDDIQQSIESRVLRLIEASLGQIIKNFMLYWNSIEAFKKLNREQRRKVIREHLSVHLASSERDKHNFLGLTLQALALVGNLDKFWSTLGKWPKSSKLIEHWRFQSHIWDSWNTTGTRQMFTLSATRSRPCASCLRSSWSRRARSWIA